MSYIHFTDEQKLRASKVDLEQYLLCQGEELIRSGREKRLKSDHSITIRGNEWYDHATRKGGGPISFLQTFYGLSYPDAVSCLLGGEVGKGHAYPEAPPKIVEPPKPFQLPPANKDMRHMYAYLIKARHISPAVIKRFVSAGLLYEDTYHNAVFVGNDEHGVARHAHKRSTNSTGNPFRMNVEGGDSRCCFHWLGTSKRLYVFEAPIDMLSYITLHFQNWEHHSYVATCGTSFIPVEWMLEQLPQVSTGILCHDNDHAGHEAAQRIAAQLRDCGVEAKRRVSQCKDWNEDAVEAGRRRNQQYQIRKEVSASCQALVF